VSPTIRRLDDDSTDGRERLFEGPVTVHAYDATQRPSRDRYRSELTMRLPVPTNRLVAFTLAGALLTAVLALALGAPVGGLGSPADPTGDSTPANAQQAADAPTPNQHFTPAVQRESGHDEEREEYDEHEEHDEEDEEGWFDDDD
jgi:hypothetical protein